jgi:hypothetical protein
MQFSLETGHPHTGLAALQPSCPHSPSATGLGRLGWISCHFLHSAGALIENLGGLAYLFSWNALGYIFMAFSQQCSVSISNYNNEKKSQSSAARRHRAEDYTHVFDFVAPIL